MMRVRKVVTRRGRHIRGYFPSAKLQRMVAWESLLERDMVWLIELSPGVLTYQEQPEEVVYWDGSQMSRYYPDFRVELVDQQCILIEVKPLAVLQRPASQQKYRAIAQHFQEREQPFLILTEREIRRQPLFDNLQLLLYPYLHANENLPSAKELKRLLGSSSPLTLAYGQQQLGRQRCLALMGQGRLVVDLEQPLGPTSLLSLPEGGQHGTAVYF